MTDKVQKILSEITTRKLCTMDEHMAFYNDKAKEDYRLLSEIEEVIKALQEEPVSEDIWETSKQYALRQVLASTDTEMTEQAYLALNMFSGHELAVAHKDGMLAMKQQMMKDSISATIESDLDPHGADYGNQKIVCEWGELEAKKFKKGTISL